MRVRQKTWQLGAALTAAALCALLNPLAPQYLPAAMATESEDNQPAPEGGTAGGTPAHWSMPFSGKLRKPIAGKPATSAAAGTKVAAPPAAKAVPMMIVQPHCSMNADGQEAQAPISDQETHMLQTINPVIKLPAPKPGTDSTAKRSLASSQGKTASKEAEPKTKVRSYWGTSKEDNPDSEYSLYWGTTGSTTNREWQPVPPPITSRPPAMTDDTMEDLAPAPGMTTTDRRSALKQLGFDIPQATGKVQVQAPNRKKTF